MTRWQTTGWISVVSWFWQPSADGPLFGTLGARTRGAGYRIRCEEAILRPDALSVIGGDCDPNSSSVICDLFVADAHKHGNVVQGHGRAPRVALVSGFWGQNIGNAFFNVGGKWILEDVFQDGDVAFIQDQPGYRTFHNQARGNPPNDFGLLRYLKVDYIVLQGPMLTQTFRSLWESTFRKLRARGTHIILLSAAFFRYTREEIDAVRAFLREFRPAIISTRDRESYELLSGCSDHLYDGIDSAFFVPDAYQIGRAHV